MQMPMGFCMPPHILEAVGPKTPSALRPLVKSAVALPMGPPWSMDIMAPMAAPKMKRLPPSRPVRNVVRAPMNQAMGTPMTYHMARQTMRVAHTGMSRIGKTDCRSLGAFFIRSFIQLTR